MKAKLKIKKAEIELTEQAKESFSTKEIVYQQAKELLERNKNFFLVVLDPATKEIKWTTSGFDIHHLMGVLDQAKHVLIQQLSEGKQNGKA